MKNPVSPICRRAVRSLRAVARLNLRQARQARLAGRPRMAAYHAQVALSSRRDANALLATAR